MRYVIVGNGITGISAAQLLRERDSAAEIVIISEESPYFYSRTALMWLYMKQLGPRQLEPFERRHWREGRYTLIQGRVTGIDVTRKELTLAATSGERQEPYDRLLLALGASPAMFGWPGQDLAGVCNMTSLEHLAQLEAVRPRLKRAVIVGGGLIGIEMVEMMLHDRRQVSYLIREPRYWEMVLSEGEAELVHERLRAAGVELILGDEIEEILGDAQGQVREVKTKGGRSLPCELVGIAVGVRSNTDLAQAAGLECGRGILVDRGMQTRAPEIYAAGDCAEVRWGEGQSQIEQLWYSGIRQGRAAGAAMMGDAVTYDPGVPYNSAQFLFLDYLNVGWMKNHRLRPPSTLVVGEQPLELAEHFQCLEIEEESIRVAYLPETGQVLGFSMLGARWSSAVLIRWIQQRRPLAWVLEHLGEATFNEEFRPSRLCGGVAHA